MECYSEQTLAFAVDGELASDEAQRLRNHVGTCVRCQKLVDALRVENRVVSESLQEIPDEAISLAGFAAPRRSWGWGELAVAAAVLAAGTIVVPWIDKLSIPSALEWLNPFSTDGLTSLIFNFSYYFANGGIAMLAEYAAVIGGFLLVGSALLLVLRWRLRQPGLRLLIVLLAFSLPSLALERRHGELVMVGANQTVDDTLLAAGDTVRIEGVVNGDLLAFGRFVDVRGSVKGDLLSFARQTVVSGRVEGRIYNVSRSLDLEGELGHSLYGWSQSIRVNDRAQVGEDVIAGGEDVSLEGDVKRGATLFAGNANVSGTVGRDLTMAGGSLTLADTARVGGNLTAHVRQLKNVQIADGATVVGKRDIQVRVRRSRFTGRRFYLHEAVWLAGAMLIGWLCLLLFPAFFQATTQLVSSGWRSLGLGLGILAAVPVAIVVAAITLVGIPLSLMLLATYLAAIYLSKIWVGAFLGRRLLRPTGATMGDWLPALLVGLVILTIVGLIPYIGGLVRLAVVCLGMGAFAWQLHRASRKEMTPSGTP